MAGCEACGGVVPDGAAFCPHCGYRQSHSKARPAAATLMRSERKIVTVLFADIKDSISLVARQDPEQAGETLAQVVEQMSEAVRRFGGVVNQVMGDGVMALFGAPLAMEDHAAQACLAALAMRSLVHERVQPRVRVRVGMSSGEVVVRAVAGDVALHYSAAGEAVHLASRMEQVAGPDQIVLTGATLQLAGGLAEVESLGKLPIKGLSGPMQTYELLRVRQRRLARAGAGHPNFVGRTSEIGRLRAALSGAEDGVPQAIRLVGEAGTGKSRLVREFTATHLPSYWTLCQAGAVPYRRTSYAVVADLLSSLFGLLPDDLPEVQRAKLAAGLAAPGYAPTEDLLPALCALLDIRPLPPAWEALEPQERRRQMIAVVAKAFQHVSTHRPIAVVVEDAHWLDAESAEAIQRLGESQQGDGLLAIATERPGQHGFPNPARWAEWQLPSLDQLDTAAMLGSLLVRDADAAGFEALLVEHTRGNPLFIEECLQALVDTGDLVREGDRFRLSRAIRVLQVPHSLRGLLDARVDRLPKDDKDVLQAASVVGAAVPLDVLGRVAAMPERALEPLLDRLCASGFLEPVLAADAASEAPSYAFRHGLIREAAYNCILLRRRTLMHGAALDVLEQRSGGGGAGTDVLANHAMLAESWIKAVSYARTAAMRAYDRYANPEAAHLYRQALDAAGHWSDGEDKTRALLGLHIATRWPLFRLGQIAGLRPHLDEAIRLAHSLDDYERLGQSHVLRSHVMWLAGEPDEALVAATAARRIAEAHADPDLLVRAEFQTALVHLTQSRITEIIASLESVLDHMGQPPPVTGRFGLDKDLAITARGWLARAHAAAGRFAAAHQEVAEAAALARHEGRRQNWVSVRMAQGVLLTAEGRPHQGVLALEQAQEHCTASDMRLLRPMVDGFLALAYVESGQAERGAALAQQSVDDAERMEFLALHPMRLAILGQARLVLGDPEGAYAALVRARALSEQIKEPGAGAYATGLMGEVYLRRGQHGAARVHYTEALEQAQLLGMHPLAASIRQRLHDPDNRAHPWLDGVALAP